MRLIDKDKLEAAVESTIEIMRRHGMNFSCEGTWAALSLIKGAPVVDAVPVARLMGGDEIAALRVNDVVWYEQHAPDGDYLAAMVANGRGEIGNADMCVALKYLDAGERLWTARPSVEQRGAVAWP